MLRAIHVVCIVVSFALAASTRADEGVRIDLFPKEVINLQRSELGGWRLSVIPVDQSGMLIKEGRVNAYVVQSVAHGVVVLRSARAHETSYGQRTILKQIPLSAISEINRFVKPEPGELAEPDQTEPRKQDDQ